jgi:hypothetical protein
MSPAFFEAVMLICFGLAWPFSIYKSYVSRRNHGKSVWFLYIILVGYINGLIFQDLSHIKGIFIFVIFAINSLMVTIDIFLYYRNARLCKKEE